jgi:hypothetical protein
MLVAGSSNRHKHGKLCPFRQGTLRSTRCFSFLANRRKTGPWRLVILLFPCSGLLQPTGQPIHPFSSGYLLLIPE